MKNVVNHLSDTSLDIPLHKAFNIHIDAYAKRSKQVVRNNLLNVLTNVKFHENIKSLVRGDH